MKPRVLVNVIVGALLVLTATTARASVGKEDNAGPAVGIERQVRQAFAEDPHLSSFPIEVEAKDDTVTLRGWVASRSAKRAAERLALGSPDVRHVVNVLEVEPSQGRRDAKLRMRLEDIFHQSPDVDAYHIEVYVRQGIVHLHGTVGSVLEKRRARAIARAVAGATRVIDRLISPSTWTWSPDWQIREDLEREIAASGVPSQRVDITVVDGVVTLDGRVRSLRAKATIEALARSAGATAVRNKLEVREDAASRRLPVPLPPA